jgi:hypothetical protein
MRDGSQFTGVLFHPRIDRGVPLDSAVESQQFRSPRRSTLFEIYGYRNTLHENWGRANVAGRDATVSEVCMDIQDAQREVRSVYIGGFWG